MSPIKHKYCSLCGHDYYFNVPLPFGPSEIAWFLKKGIDLKKWDAAADSDLKAKVVSLAVMPADAADFRVYRWLNPAAASGVQLAKILKYNKLNRPELVATQLDEIVEKLGDICPYCRTMPLAAVRRRIGSAQGWRRATLYTAMLATFWRSARAPRSVWRSSVRRNIAPKARVEVPDATVKRETPRTSPVSVAPVPQMPARAAKAIPVKAPPKVTANPLQLLGKAKAFSDARDWQRARDCASQAIEAKPDLVEAYSVRALAYRVLGNLDLAIADYDKIIERHPQNGEAWMFRGACRTQKAASAEGPFKQELMRDAHVDYKRAAELDARNELAWLALLEFEICIADYKGAIGTTGTCWKMVAEGPNRVVCAWLGAIAMIMAGRPENRRRHFVEYLQNDDSRLATTLWSVAEIEGHLKILANSECDPAKLEQLNRVHELFLNHFGKGGPGIR